MQLPGPLVERNASLFSFQGCIKLTAFPWLKRRAVFLPVCAVSFRKARDPLLGQQAERERSFGSHFLCPHSSSLLCIEKARLFLFPALH